MTSVPLDPDGEARRALNTAVEDFGPRALSNPVVLANLFKDLLPDSPRETNVLVMAAEAGLAKAITDRIDQGLPADAATHQAATMVADARAMDPTAALWAARQFAGVLGHDVPADTAAGPSGAAGGAAAAGGVAAAAPAWPAAADQGTTGATSPWAAPPAWPGSGGEDAANPLGGAGATSPGATVPGVPAANPGPPITNQPTEVVGPATSGWGSTGWGSDGEAAGVPGSTPSNYGAAPGYGAAPAAGGGAYGGTTPPPAWGASAPAGGGWTPTPGPRKSRAPWYLGGAAVAAVIAVVVVLLVVNSGGGKSNAASTTSTPATTTPIGSSTTVAPTTTAPSTTTTTIASGLTAAEQALAALLPTDADASFNCQTLDSPPTGLTHLKAALSCDGPSASGTDPGVPNGQIFGYQFDSAATYQAGLVQYNKDKAFTPSQAGKTCPPSGSHDDGNTTWSNPAKNLNGQLECFSASSNNSKTDTQPVYIWTIPSRYVIVEAVGDTNWPFSKLNTWFLHWGMPQ